VAEVKLCVEARGIVLHRASLRLHRLTVPRGIICGV